MQNSYVNKISKDIDDEKVNIYKEVCQCTSQCLILNNNSNIQLDNKAEICNKISLDNISSSTSRRIINKSLKFLVDSNYIKAIRLIDSDNPSYYITLNNTNVKLTWENIKSIKDKEIKELFWLFRKLVVDNLLKIIIDDHSKENPEIFSDFESIRDIKQSVGLEDFVNMKIYSVGSTEISSDYDITLFSNNSDALGLVIEDFQVRFTSIFGEHSSIVFDTNIYGKAYIVFDCTDTCNINYRPIILDKCPSQKEIFYYLKSLNNENEGIYKYTQVLWGLIKYFRDLRDSFGEPIYNKYLSFLKHNVDNDEILDITSECLIYLRNINNTYSELIKSEKQFRINYANYSRLLFDNDYISLINFYGEETYFTRGAFLDTVINSQMCGGNLNKYMKDIKDENSEILDIDIVRQFVDKLPIKLNDEDYIASILENSGFFFLHNDKTKYLKRIKISLTILSNINKEYLPILESIYFHELSNISSDNYNYCNWIDDNDFNLLKCEKYDMFQVILKIIYRILKIYFKNINFIDFPFHTIFIQGNIRSPTEKDIIPDYLPISSFNSNVNSGRNSTINKIDHNISTPELNIELLNPVSPFGANSLNIKNTRNRARAATYLPKI